MCSTSKLAVKSKLRAGFTLALLAIGFLLSLSSGFASTRELFVIVLCGLLLLFILPRRRPRLLSVEGGLYCFILGLLPSLALSPAFHLSSLTFAKLIAACGYLLGAHYLANEVSELWPKKCLTILLIGGLLLLTLFGLEQMIFPQEMPAHWVSQQQHDVLPFRVTSLFINPNPWGGFCALVTALLFAATLQVENSRDRRGLLVLFVLILINLTATFSRGAWLAAFISLILTTAFIKWRKLPAPGWKETLGTLMVTLLILSFWLYLPVKARLDSMKKSGELGMNQRSLLYRGVFRHIKANLPFGSGLRTFQTLFPRYRLAGGQYVYEAHSDLLHILAESGLPGFLGLLAMGSIFLCLCGQKENPSLLGMATLFGFIVAANVVTFLHYTFMTIPLFIVVGATLPKPKERAAEWSMPGQIVFLLFVFFCLLYWQRLWSSQPYFEQANALYRLASNQSGNNRRILLNEAANQLEQCVSWLPWRDDAIYLRARVVLAQGELDEARKILEIAQKHNPLEVTYCAALGDVEKRAGKGAAALARFNEALSGDPYSESLMLKKALLLENMGRVDEAIDLLRAALQTNPQFLKINRKAYEPVFSNLVRILISKGDIEAVEKVKETYGKLLSLPLPTR